MKKKGDKKGLKSTRICYKVSENKKIGVTTMLWKPLFEHDVPNALRP